MSHLTEYRSDIDMLRGYAFFCAVLSLSPVEILLYVWHVSVFKKLILNWDKSQNWVHDV
jgi:hypothetical protein